MLGQSGPFHRKDLDLEVRNFQVCCIRCWKWAKLVGLVGSQSSHCSFYFYPHLQQQKNPNPVANCSVLTGEQ